LCLTGCPAISKLKSTEKVRERLVGFLVLVGVFSQTEADVILLNYVAWVDEMRKYAPRGAPMVFSPEIRAEFTALIGEIQVYFETDKPLRNFLFLSGGKLCVRGSASTAQRKRKRRGGSTLTPFTCISKKYTGTSYPSPPSNSWSGLLVLWRAMVALFCGKTLGLPS
jgi:hypothetical protein